MVKTAEWSGRWQAKGAAPPKLVLLALSIPWRKQCAEADQRGAPLASTSWLLEAIMPVEQTGEDAQTAIRSGKVFVLVFFRPQCGPSSDGAGTTR